ncbi:MAG TPA: hypothetical protein PLL17_07355 [Defluviitaleaceae bacterium]|jgi:hypothetical protein|nr:hypothetical protein [Defluviitaleaceae bacterium]HQD50925.1 hypothetical protein [Defluviitaleaceae bacterium]
MKKAIIISLYTVLGILIVMCIIVYKILFSVSVPVDVSFAETAYIRAEEYGEMPEIYTQIKQEDLEFLKSIFNRTAWKETPSCPCNGVELIFKSEKKDLIIYPAGDGCPTMRIEEDGKDYYFHITDEDNEKFKKMLEGYGIIYNFGI